MQLDIIEDNKISLLLRKFKESDAPEKKVLLVSGGLAMKRKGVWYTGMEEPLYSKPLEWTPTWWCYLPK